MNLVFDNMHLVFGIVNMVFVRVIWYLGWLIWHLAFGMIYLVLGTMYVCEWMCCRNQYSIVPNMWVKPVKSFHIWLIQISHCRMQRGDKPIGRVKRKIWMCVLLTEEGGLNNFWRLHNFSQPCCWPFHKYKRNREKWFQQRIQTHQWYHFRGCTVLLD